METQAIPIISACWFGILTSISPCPLASNIAAISYIVKGVEKPSSVLTTGLMYTLGRMITYIALGTLISASLLNIPQASQFMQNIMPKILGPVLILTGFFLLGLLRFSLPGFLYLKKQRPASRKMGLSEHYPWASFLLFHFALFRLLFSLEV